MFSFSIGCNIYWLMQNFTMEGFTIQPEIRRATNKADVIIMNVCCFVNI